MGKLQGLCQSQATDGVGTADAIYITRPEVGEVQNGVSDVIKFRLGWPTGEPGSRHMLANTTAE